MSNQPPRELTIDDIIEAFKRESLSDTARGALFAFFQSYYDQIEKIARLEAALKKCREQRGICTRTDHINGPCDYQIKDKELESILESK
jgi:hypothetical protein